jgi:GTP-binding protein
MSRPGVRVEVIGKVGRAEHVPDLALPVVVAAGRSNVGKSSLLNALVGRTRQFRTSKTPGCTRTIELVSVSCPEGSFVLADLPGYGYAALSRERRAGWGPLIEGFLAARGRRVTLALMLVDVRRGPEAEEDRLLEYLERLGIPAVVVLTKCDKLARSKARAEVERMRKRFPGRRTVATSASSGEGLDLLWRWMLPAEEAAAEPPPRKEAP